LACRREGRKRVGTSPLIALMSLLCPPPIFGGANARRERCGCSLCAPAFSCRVCALERCGATVDSWPLAAAAAAADAAAAAAGRAPRSGWQDVRAGGGLIERWRECCWRRHRLLSVEARLPLTAAADGRRKTKPRALLSPCAPTPEEEPKPTSPTDTDTDSPNPPWRTTTMSPASSALRARPRRWCSAVSRERGQRAPCLCLSLLRARASS
jgi:hypothetical protein